MGDREEPDADFIILPMLSPTLSPTGNSRGKWADRALLGWRAAELSNRCCVHGCGVLKAVGMLTSPLKLRGGYLVGGRWRGMHF